MLVLVAAGVWSVLNPQAFLDLWLTPDQQGRLWFRLGDYERASRTFEDPRWRGFSLYAAEDFETAENYFSQYEDAASLLARGNAFAHAGDYISAKRIYEDLARQYPDHPAPATNIPLMENLKGTVEEKSDDESSEGGEPDQDSGEDPSSSEGTEKEGEVELEQYDADQLLQDPGLTDMWLRQIQRDPSEFLKTKFSLQVEQKEEASQ